MKTTAIRQTPKVIGWNGNIAIYSTDVKMVTTKNKQTRNTMVKKAINK